jgi:hypothetical protein
LFDALVKIDQFSIDVGKKRMFFSISEKNGAAANKRFDKFSANLFRHRKQFQNLWQESLFTTWVSNRRFISYCFAFAASAFIRNSHFESV